jgi:hypothetical protein
VHAHFFHPPRRAPTGRRERRPAPRGGAHGGHWHVASVLGTWGGTSPTYFASPDDVRLGNDVAYAVARACPSACAPTCT